jgi:hypothetical protein
MIESEEWDTCSPLTPNDAAAFTASLEQEDIELEQERLAWLAASAQTLARLEQELEEEMPLEDRN